MSDDLTRDLEAIASAIPAAPRHLAELRWRLQNIPAPSATSLPGARLSQVLSPEEQEAGMVEAGGSALGEAGIGTIPGTAVTPGTVTDFDLADGSLSVAKFASGIVPPRVVDTLPTLPDANYPIGSIVFLTTDSPPALYKTTTGLVGSWTKLVDAGDIISNSITAGQIAAGAIGADEIAAGAVTTSKLNLEDEYGSTILTSQGFGDTWTRFIQTGLYNADFRLLPDTPADPISGTNPLPYWTLASSGATCSIKSTAAATASGRSLTFTAPATSSTDGLWEVSQQVPVVAGRAGQATSYFMRASLKMGANVDANVKIGIWMAWYEADGTTYISGSGDTWLTSAFAASSTVDLFSDLGPAPAEAQYGSIRLAIQRVGAHSSDISFELSDADLGDVSLPRLALAEWDAPSAYGEGRMWQGNGALWIAANQGGLSGHGSYILIDGSAETTGDTIYLCYDGTNIISFGDNGDFTKASSRVSLALADFRTADGLLITKSKTGAITDSDFYGSAANGAIGVDITNHRFYFRESGTWRYISYDGGFSIPAHETNCPCCNEPLLPGDAMVGKGEKFEGDGALHGLWVHLRCADKPLIGGS